MIHSLQKGVAEATPFFELENKMISFFSFIIYNKVN